MNQEDETSPMKKESFNFEFLREVRVDIAEAAAAAEWHALDENPGTALREIRFLVQELLKLFFVQNGGQTRSGNKDKSFDDILEECRDQAGNREKTPDLIIPDDIWKVVDSMRYELNKAVHPQDPPDIAHSCTYANRSGVEIKKPVDYLKQAHHFGCWIYYNLRTRLNWKTGPNKFDNSLPCGGKNYAELRSQRDEAARRAAGLPIDLSRWAAEQSITPFQAKKFTGRDWVYRRIEQFLNQDEKRVLVIQGDPGRGKSGVMAQFIDKHSPKETTACWHFFVDSQGEPRDWICRFYSALLNPDEIKSQEPHLANADQTALLREFRRRLSNNTLASQKQLIFVIDAVDEAGTSKDAVAEFLRSEFPPNVRVLATVRPTHFDASRCPLIEVFDFEHPDVRNDHRNDGLAFVRAIAPANLSDDTLRAIGEIGDGNFLVLSLICQELPTSALEVETYLQQLRNLEPGAPLYEALFQRAWKRLRRLSHEAPRNVYQTLALLAVCRQPLTSEMIKGVLKFETSDWDKLIDNVGEYVREDIIFVDGTQTEVFRLYHATFADFVSVKLKSDVRRMELRLATSCRDWIHEAPTEFERAYALRFVIHHFVHAQAWNDVEALLTDLQFIQARFESGKGYDLVDEYETVLRQHPKQDNEYLSRLEQDEELQKYVQEIVKYSRRCTQIRNRHERGECDDPLAEFAKNGFPRPPSTDFALKAIGRNKTLGAHPSNPRTVNSAFNRIWQFHIFLSTELQLLVDVPDATIDIARNYARTGAVSEAASKLESTRKNSTRLIQHTSRNSPPANSLNSTIIREIKRYYDDYPTTWTTPDCRYGYIGPTMFNRLGSIFDLRTGENIGKRLQVSGVPISLSIDGQWAIFADFDVKSYLWEQEEAEVQAVLHFVDLAKSRVVDEYDCKIIPAFGKTWKLTPDGDLAIGVTRTEIVIWNAHTQQKTLIPLCDLELEKNFTPTNLTLSPSGSLARISGKTLLVSWDDTEPACLIPEEVTCSLITRAPIHAEDAKSSGPLKNDLETLNVASQIDEPLSTPDGRLWLEASNVDGTKKTTLYVKRGEQRESICFDETSGLPLSLSADGCCGLVMQHNRFSVIDLTRIYTSTAPNESSTHLTSSSASLADSYLIPVDPKTQAFEVLSELGCDIHQPETELNGSRLPGVLKIQGQPQWLADCTEIVPLPDGTILLRSNQATYTYLTQEEMDRLRESWNAPRIMELIVNGLNDLDTSHPQNTNTQLRSYFTDMQSGECYEVKCAGQFLGVTQDASALIFDQEGVIRFWNLQKQQWLTECIFANDARSFECARMRASPDGRLLVFSQVAEKPVVANLITGRTIQLERTATDHDRRINETFFLPDGSLILDQSDDQTYLWSNDGQMISTANGQLSSETASSDRGPYVDAKGFVWNADGRPTGIQVINPQRSPIWVTGVRLFRMSLNAETVHKESNSRPAEFIGNPIPGVFEKEISYKCLNCGRRDLLPDAVLETIRLIHSENRIHPTDSPVLTLNNDAWDVRGLNFECPHCNQPLRSTPFYVDRRPR